MKEGLYLHVPFCLRKCGYCGFFSRDAKPEMVEAWLAEMEGEALELPVGFAPSSVFLGGGTPTVLSESEMARLLEMIHERVDLRNVVEWTCEVNPGTVSPEKFAQLKRGGVNRISIGAQSFCAATLQRLGRIHSAEETRMAVGWAREAGFENVSLDLMYGIPGVSQQSVEADIEAALSLKPEHLSCYCLEIEEKTPLSREAEQGGWVVYEDQQLAQFDWVRKRLTGDGFEHVEISNFARPGRECQHNLLYWCGGKYIGVGPAAHSHWRGVRWGNSAELPVWQREFEERLEPRAKACETLVMGLRRIAGWGREEFFAATGFTWDALRGDEIARLAAEGLLVVTPERIRLAEEALFISDSVFAELV